MRRLESLPLDSKFRFVRFQWFPFGKIHSKCSECFACTYTAEKGGKVKLGRNISVDPKTRVCLAE